MGLNDADENKENGEFEERLNKFAEQLGKSNQDRVHDPLPLAEAAFYGLAGDFVRLIEPHSESDPAALLISLLTAFGNIIGNNPHFLIEAAKHPMRIFVVIVGQSSKSRKGTSWRYVERVFSSIDPSWQINSGLSSGEGVIYAVRDKVTKLQTNNKTSQTEEIILDEGITDKRLLVIEEEFSAVLRIVNRQGNILSQLVRSAWEKDKLQTLTKNNPLKSTKAHISIIGHITIEELLRYLTSTEISNGFGNRFLYIFSKRSKELPNGGNLNESDLQHFIEKLKIVVDFIQELNKPSWTSEEIDTVTNNPAFTEWPTDTRVKWSEQAQPLWNKIYHDLSQEELGIVGALTSRAEAYICRLASIFALLDMSFEIRVEHLRAAVAVWDYSYSSVRFIFHGKTGDPLANKIIEALSQNSAGLTRSDISNYFSRNINSEQLSISLETLLKLGRVRSEPIETEGRPSEFFSLNSFSSYSQDKTFLEKLDEYIAENDKSSQSNSNENNETNEISSEEDQDENLE